MIDCILFEHCLWWRKFVVGFGVRELKEQFNIAPIQHYV